VSATNARYDLEPGELIDRALIRFKKLAVKQGVFADMRRHEERLKPCEARRKKHKLALKRIRRAAKKRAEKDGD
jgi:ribosomal protein S21